MNKALVLGGSGFLGSHLLDELISHSINITALVHKNTLFPGKQNINMLTGSLTDFNWHSLENDLPDVIFHSARMGGHNKKTRIQAARQNRQANKRLIRWLETLQSPPLLVFVSGSLVYGSHGKQRIDENQPPNPISFQREYFEAEEPILENKQSGKIPVRIVRPSWIYGHGSWFQAFFLNYMNKKRKVPMYGKGNNLMSFVHVRDCAAMMIRVAQYGEENAIFNLYTESAVTQKNFSHLLAENAKLSLKQVPLWWISLRFDRAVSEAFRFSLNLSTHHSRIWEQYTPYYPSIGLWIQKVLGANNKAD